MSTNPPDPNVPKPGGLLARLRGMYQSMKPVEEPEAVEEEVLPTFDVPEVAPVPAVPESSPPPPVLEPAPTAIPLSEVETVPPEAPVEAVPAAPAAPPTVPAMRRTPFWSDAGAVACEHMKPLIAAHQVCSTCTAKATAVANATASEAMAQRPPRSPPS